MFFGEIYFSAVFENMPVPVPMSRKEVILWDLRYSFRKFAKRYESSEGW